MARLEVMGGRGAGRFQRASADYPITTFAWAAPEMLFGGEQTDAVDIYALGVVLWEIVTHVSGLIGSGCCCCLMRRHDHVCARMRHDRDRHHVA